MEILLAIVVLGAVAYYFFKPKKVEEKVEVVAPYKVETPEPEKVKEQITDAVTAPPAKKPAAKKPAAKKPAAKKAVAKKPVKKSKKSSKSE